MRGQSRHPESSEKGCSWASRVSLKLPFPRQAEGKGHREHSQGALKQPFPRQARGKGNRKGLKLVSRIVRTGPLLGVQGVQNSSFEFQRALFTLLVEEKAIGLKICVFRSTCLFLLPVEESARKTSETLVLSHAIAFSLCLSRKRRQKEK